MEFYKPYPFLYKDSANSELKACFYIKLKKDEYLSAPDVAEESHATTLTYTITRDTSYPSEHKEEFCKILAWDGLNHQVTIIVGTGGGGTGGTAIVDSADFD